MKTLKTQAAAFAKAAQSQFPNIKYRVCDDTEDSLIEVGGYLYITPLDNDFMLEEEVYSPGNWHEPPDVDIVDAGMEKTLFNAVLAVFVKAATHAITQAMEAEAEALFVPDQEQYLEEVL